MTLCIVACSGVVGWSTMCLKLPGLGGSDVFLFNYVRVCL